MRSGPPMHADRGEHSQHQGQAANGSAIYVLDADGSGLHRITPIRLNAGKPDWSPNGSNRL